MFKNVGKQIKIFAVVFFILGIIGCLLIVMAISSVTTSLGFIYFIASILVTVGLTLLIYGFGQLIYKVERINDNLEDLKEIIAKKNF